MIIRLSLLAAIVFVSACADKDAASERRSAAQHHFRTTNTIIPAESDIISFASESAPARPTASAKPNPDRNAYFGDLHVHTTLSFDGAAFGTTATPADAYRYAQGEAIQHPGGFDIQLAQPLDFYAVTDHAMFLGVINEAADTTTAFSKYDFSKPFHNLNASVDGGFFDVLKRSGIFEHFLNDAVANLMDGTFDGTALNDIAKSAWVTTVEAANEAYKPGHFTTFAAYEYSTSTSERGNLHRNVIFRAADRLPALPFSRLNSLNPEDLWDWMDKLRDQGIESLAIPHNSNGSNGAMFALADWEGKPIDQSYVEQRTRNEPVVEITQIKGTSDTHPLLSKNDEWADFGIAPFRIGTMLPSAPEGSYVRNAWLRGLSLAEAASANPYQFGVIGSTDTHTGASPIEEDKYPGKVGIIDATTERRGSIPASFLYGTLVKLGAPDRVDEVDGKTYLKLDNYKFWGASGIAGVWAEENTREAIYDALRRKETFATTGTRIRVRFFAGYDLANAKLDSTDLIRSAYSNAVPMGGTLAASADRAPSFLTWAIADPNTAKLQRVQIIKGWLENGEHQERVYDVACSDGLRVDPKTHRCPDNGARVNINDCSISADVGATELKTLWQDPDFEAGQEAFYYVRVLENPVCQWTTWDAVRSGVAPRPDIPATFQERAWSSPIWYSASGS